MILLLKKGLGKKRNKKKKQKSRKADSLDSRLDVEMDNYKLVSFILEGLSN